MKYNLYAILSLYSKNQSGGQTKYNWCSHSQAITVANIFKKSTKVKIHAVNTGCLQRNSKPKSQQKALKEK